MTGRCRAEPAWDRILERRALNAPPRPRPGCDSGWAAGEGAGEGCWPFALLPGSPWPLHGTQGVGKSRERASLSLCEPPEPTDGTLRPRPLSLAAIRSSKEPSPRKGLCSERPGKREEPPAVGTGPGGPRRHCLPPPWRGPPASAGTEQVSHRGPDRWQS